MDRFVASGRLEIPDLGSARIRTDALCFCFDAFSTA